MNQSIRILIVDDDPNIVSSTARVMEKAGYTVDTASNGEEALQSVQDHHPDLLLLDRYMPGIDGIEVCHRIKQDAAMANSFVVLVSGTYVESDQQAEGLESGADGYIARPIANRELLARVEAFVRILLLTRSLRIQAEELQKSNETITQAHLAALNVMEDTLTARVQLQTSNQELRNEIIVRKKAEKERERLTQKMEVLLGTTDEGIYGMNIDGCCTFINRAGAEMVGWGEDEIIGLNMHDILHHHKQDGSPYLVEDCPIFKGFKSGEGIRVDTEVFWRKDHTYFSVEYSSHPIREQGVIVGAVVSFSDITKRRNNEEALRNSNENFLQLADNVTDAFWIRSPDMREVHYVSPAFERIWGRPRESLYANPQQWSDFTFPEDRKRVLSAFAALTGDTASLDIEYRILRPTGEIRWVRLRGFQIRDAAKKLIRLTGIVTDITDTKQAHEKLLASEARYRRLFESAKDSIVILDADSGNIVDVNPFLIELLDYPREYFMGKQLWEIGYFKDIDANQAAFRKLQNEKYIRYENLPLVTKGGRTIWVEFISNLYDVNGKQVIQCNIRDVTERKQAEQELRLKTALLDGFACVGQTAGGVTTHYAVPGSTPMWESTGAVCTTYTQDGRGNIGGLVSGNILKAKFSYNAFGKMTTVDPVSGNVLPNSSGLRYRGEMYDAVTNRVNLRNRTYNPGTGQFDQADPIGYGGGMNLYGYCGGEPVNRTDPMGTDWMFSGAGNWTEVAPFNTCARPPEFYKAESIGERYTAHDESMLRFSLSLAHSMGERESSEFANVFNPSTTNLGMISSICGANPGNASGYYSIAWNNKTRQFYPNIGMNYTPSAAWQKLEAMGETIRDTTEFGLLVGGKIGDAMDDAMPILVSIDMSCQQSGFCPFMAAGELLEGAGRGLAELRVLGAMARDAQGVRMLRSLRSPIYFEMKGIGLNMEMGQSFVRSMRFRSPILSAVENLALDEMIEAGQLRVVKPNGNSLLATGSHDVYAIREAGSGRVLHIGETGRGYLTRGAEWKRFFDKLGIKTQSPTLIGTVEGKMEALGLQTRYLDAFKKAFGKWPEFNFNGR